MDKLKIIKIKKVESVFKQINLKKLSKLTVRWKGTDEKKLSSTKVGNSSGKSLNFDDFNVAVINKTNSEIIRSWLVFTLCQIPFLSKHGEYLARRFSAILGERIFSWIMKMTFYGHFVGGEDDKKIQPTMKRMRSFGVNPILDYAAESDLSHEEAENLEEASSIPVKSTPAHDAIIQKYKFNKKFADRRDHVISAHVYFYQNENACDENMENFLRCIDAVSTYPHGQGIAAIKVTALTRPQILLQLSEIIMRTRKFMTDLSGSTEKNILKHYMSPEDLKKKLENFPNYDKFMSKVTADEKGIIHLFPWSQLVDEKFELQDAFMIPNIKTGKVVRLVEKFSKLEAESFHGMLRRLHLIAKEALKRKVFVTLDAEHSYFQPAISRLCLELMRIYNKEDAYIWNTYQGYLKDSYNEITADLEQAKRQNFYFGAKLVRGAYMFMERARAKEMGYPDPINDTYEDTTAMYHKIAMEVLGKIKEDKQNNRLGRHQILIASHNENTVKHVIEKMNEFGILNSDKVVSFAQLTGMCDFMTYTLSNEQYRVYKYLPFGPVVEVVPYLARRVQENRGLLGNVGKERKMLTRALFSRLAKGQLFYEPKGKLKPV